MPELMSWIDHILIRCPSPSLGCTHSLPSTLPESGHSAREEALPLAAARWVPKILAAGATQVLLLPVWLINSGDEKELDKSWHLCCHGFSQGSALKVCVLGEFKVHLFTACCQVSFCTVNELSDWTRPLLSQQKTAVS